MDNQIFDVNPWIKSSKSDSTTDEPDRIRIWVKKLFDDGTELSPIISPNDISDANVVRRSEINTRILPGIDANGPQQLALLEGLGTVWADIKVKWEAEKTDDHRFHYNNGSYSYFDAMTLAAMLVKKRPNKVLAFVDQFQYACFLDVIEKNELDSTTCIFIEPDPNRLQTYSPLPENSRHKIYCSGIKTLGTKFFSSLGDNDLLFVDTTHVAKAGSDVCRLFNTVLPNLQVGVVVHIHDIFWPFEYPEGWLAEGRSWNELYVLRAWLQFNEHYSVKLFLHYLWSFHKGDCEKAFPDSKLNPGGALWLQRVKK